jgi:hypothetical protein
VKHVGCQSAAIRKQIGIREGWPQRRVVPNAGMPHSALWRNNRPARIWIGRSAAESIGNALQVPAAAVSWQDKPLTSPATPMLASQANKHASRCQNKHHNKQHNKQL